jgi:hypothetical protein
MAKVLISIWRPLFHMLSKVQEAISSPDSSEYKKQEAQNCA